MKKNKKVLLALLMPLMLASVTLATFTSCSETVSSSNQILNQHYDGEGTPLDSFGNNGDSYKDLLTNNEYIKVSGHWILIGNSNPQQLSGEGVPSNNLGNNGDFYTDLTNENYYNKQNGIWVLIREGDVTQIHTVTFDLNGGMTADGSISIPSQEVKHGEWVTKPADPRKQNCTFAGWYVDGEKWSFHASVYADIVLVAKYNVNEDEKVTLFIDPNNGEEKYSIDTFFGETPRISSPSKEGYNFVGWFFSDNGERFSGTIGEGMNGRTIIARFDKSKFNFTYQIESNDEVTITGLIDVNSVSINIPEKVNGYSVTAIGEKAFQNRISLVTVNLPKSIKTIHPKCFNGARMLSEILVDSTNPYFTSVSGILYTKDMKELRHCPPKNLTSLTLPSTVTKIGDYAFYQHKDGGISKIVFNEGLVEIGNRSFYECTALTSLRFPSTLRIVGEGAFNCVSAVGCIQDVYFNEGLEVIGDSAFVGAYFKDAFKLPSSVKEIGSYAFANCTAITKFTFPQSLQTLGGNVFAGATGILEIDIEQGNSNFVVNNNILYTADMKKAVMCPSGNTAKVVIPEGVEEIADYAFYMVDKTLKYEFPSTLKTIGKQAFAHCYELVEFNIPNSVESIGDNCFDSCFKLKNITFGTSLKEIPVEAFIDCYSLQSLVIPGNVKTINKRAFFGCSAINSITFNEGLLKIDNSAFCFSTTEYNDEDTASLTTIELPNSLEVLGDSVFVNQKALKTLKIGDNLKEFGESILDETSVDTIIVSDKNQYFTAEGGILYTKDHASLIYAVSSLKDTLVLPEGVKVIKPYAFAKCSSLTGITLPNSLEEIQNNAFDRTKIGTFNFGPNLKKIGNQAFYLSSVNEVSFSEGIEEIGDEAFDSINIETLTLPNSLKVLGAEAFKGCWKLLTLNIGNGLVSIGDEAFRKCNKLAGEVVLPSTIKKLGVGLFAESTKVSSIKFNGECDFISVNDVLMDKNKTAVYGIAPASSNVSLELPSTVTEIKRLGLASSACTSLTLPEGLQTINEEAFYKVNALATISIPSSVTYVGNAAFKDWGKGKVTQIINFNCTEDYALSHFDTQYLSGISTTATKIIVNYMGN